MMNWKDQVGHINHKFDKNICNSNPIEKEDKDIFRDYWKILH
jgi:hypothetical protein